MNNKFNHCLKKSPLAISVYASAITLFMAAFIAVLMQGTYGKSETAKGLIRNESFYRVAASKVGNVTEIYVTEGEKVNKGTPLFRVALPWQDVPDQQNGNSMLAESVARLVQTKKDFESEEELQQREWDTLKKQKENVFLTFEEKNKKLSDVEKDYQRKYALYKDQLRELNALLKLKSINKSDVENMKQLIIDNELAIKKTQLEQHTLLQNRSEQEVNYLRMERELLRNKNEIEGRKREIINELNKIQMEQEYVVTSPVTGNVHDIGILKGDFVDGKTPSMIIKEDAAKKPIVILYLTSSQIGLINQQEKIFLRVDTFPYETYGLLSALITNISQTPTQVSLDEKESLFRVKLKINEDDGHTRIPVDFLNDGMSVTTSLRQPGQSLLAWLFMPVKKSFNRNPDFAE
ncbi:HlyD family secretion protein [Erwinia psidii]|uniref:HlyD family efflux transporter periplasmic adaptor subunit n=1 Tax=Erwinia psidii TaxID=69224 RepID=A0A3N6S0T7_9GAMM|nr:HlyD family efflux transporter periplasmic adaptor subunit [Erwinia psidii]MCX8956153.1 HlyD family efflux transporter periplasmic adaptor subunit [Erwinia psidii]MCX8960087.1 HlyD family efflux transporter periplasmic adaptor subunit [Erwinia psidii]MCX8963633.1 HlyD family efflux transporter periplasmic adaptor subunit [Erwinia psidii]RQM39158.1 HlyD family efflux transporter periplasmic adaptor subunit [Erwinia psidii]